MESSSASSATSQLKFCKPDGDDRDASENQTLSSDALLRKMFESQSGDWEMIGLDGQAYKFHEAVLKEQVTRFRTILAHPDTKEFQSKQIIVPPELEMTGSAVEAFLRYAYYQDVVPIKSSLEITCALIRTGHYYDIPKMVAAANEALHSNGILKKNPDWLHFDESLKLYKEVWLWEEGHPSKKKLMKNLVVIIKDVSKRKATAGSVPTGSGPLMDLIRTLLQDEPCLPIPTTPIRRSPNPTKKKDKYPDSVLLKILFR